MTSLVGRQVTIKRGADGKAKLVRRSSYMSKKKKLKDARIEKAWKAKSR